MKYSELLGILEKMPIREIKKARELLTNLSNIMQHMI